MGWAEAIYPYVKSVGVYACPDDPTNVAGSSVDSYAMNSNFYSWTGSAALTLAQLNAPSVTVALFEVQHVWLVVLPPASDMTYWYTNVQVSASGNGAENQWGLSGVNAYGAWNASQSGLYATGPIGGCSSLLMTASATGVHTGGANYLAADGHVKWLRPNLVSGGNTAAAASNPGTGVCTGNPSGAAARAAAAAAGTGSMALTTGGATATLTFSPT
jgi:prepilin-type processing-associated H-X9-DG protein